MAAAARAARVALIERLRRVDEAVLDTLLVSSLSPELGPDDVAAALRIGRRAGTRTGRSRACQWPHSRRRTATRSCGPCTRAWRRSSAPPGTTTSKSRSSALANREVHAVNGSRTAGWPTTGCATRSSRMRSTELAARNRGHPGQAARLYRAATEVGATALNARLADALALTGDCGNGGPARRRTADVRRPRRTCGGGADRRERRQSTTAARPRRPSCSAGWAPTPTPSSSAAGAVVAIGVGDAAAARAAIASESAGPPTSTARAARSLAEGLIHTLDSPYPVAMARLAQSITSDQPASGRHPRHPGRSRHARRPSRRRSRSRPHASSAAPCAPQATTRASPPSGTDCCSDGSGCRRGNWPRPAPTWRRRAPVPTCTAGTRCGSPPLQTAIARRGGDSGAVQKHWYAAMEVLTEYSLDLYSLLPLGELWVAAGRLRQVDRLRHTIDEAFDLLGRPRQSAAVVAAAALGGRACGHPGELTGSRGTARPGVDGRRGPQRVRQGAGHRGPHLAAGAGQPR